MDDETAETSASSDDDAMRSVESSSKRSSRRRSFLRFAGALAKTIIMGFEPPALSEKLHVADAILGRWRIIASWP